MKIAKAPKKNTTVDPMYRGSPLLSLDVSSSCIGWATFRNGFPESFGLIKSPSSWDSRRRIANNTVQVHQLLIDKTAEGQYTNAVMEWQSHKRSGRCINAQGLAVLGQAQGAVWQMLRASHRVLSVDQVSERDWTKQMGVNIQKATRAKQVMLLCPEYGRRIQEEPGWDKGMDVADAIMLGFWRLSIQ